MTAQEKQQQQKRIEEMTKLEKVLEGLYSALRAITEDWPDGPHGQNPFTGNWRESRQVLEVSIKFTATRGGAAPTQIDIPAMYIEASDMGIDLQHRLRARIETIEKEMEKI